MILVVDDDEGVRETCAYWLGKQGLAVRTAPNGRGALAMLQEKPARTLLIDIYMPDMDGIEMIRQARLEHPGLRIVAMSGSGCYDVLKAATALGADATLEKPFRAEQLFAAILDQGHVDAGR